MNNQPREVTVFYYCDYFEQREASVVEISEPDWCKYHVKIMTKYMCGRWSNVYEREMEAQKRTEIRCRPRVIQ